MSFFKRSDAPFLRTVGELSAVGFAFLLALALGFWLGRGLDRWFGTTPWLTVVFALLGLAAGVLNVYRIVSHALQSDSRS